MARRRGEGQGTKQSRKVSIIGIMIVVVGIVLVNLIPSIALELGLTTAWCLMFFAMFLIVVGVIAWFKYGGVWEKEMTGIYGRALVIGLAFSVLGSAIALVGGSQLPKEQSFLSLIFGIALFLVGVAIVVGGAIIDYLTRPTPPSILELCQEIEPERTFKARTFTVFRKGDIHILVPNTLDGAYFVRMFSKVPAPDEKKVRVPRLFLRFAFKDEVLGLPLAKRRGDFTIPVDAVERGGRIEESYVKGPGILYYVSVMPQFLSEKFDKTAILNIMQKLSKEQSSRIMHQIIK